MKKTAVKRTLAERERLFSISLQAYIPVYGENMIEDFFDYWTECNEGGKKMRFEKEKTWCIDRRLKRWFRNLSENKRKAVNDDVMKRLHEYKAVANEFRKMQSDNTEQQ